MTRKSLWAALITAGVAITACANTGAGDVDLILVDGRVYTFDWADPAPDGAPAADAPYDAASGWRPDAEAVVVAGNDIVFVGSSEEALSHQTAGTRVLDLGGATVLPGLVDSHVHIAELGRSLEQVSLVDVATEEEAVERVVARAADVPPGEWITGWGWDEGAWANRYPTVELLSERVPDHPVYLRGLHGFAVWGNRLALERAGITADTPDPGGGEILRDANGEPTGILTNRATALLADAMPAPGIEQVERQILRGLEEMARSGYVAVHEAGADAEVMEALERLDAAGRLPLRVFVMLDGRDPALLDRWAERGPHTGSDMLVVRSVKAYYDGALGSRGALLLEDYADRPGHRGTGDQEYGFDASRLTRMAGAGFQLAVHAIGDAGNRNTLDFYERVYAAHPGARSQRNRIEHAQVVHPADFERFGALDLIASMEPPHAMEDKAWARERLGPDRIRGGYAWRTLRESGVPLAFNSDLPGSDHDILYGLLSAVARRDKQGEPDGGWYADQRMTAEEAVRGYTSWGAYAGFDEARAGHLAPGMRADITVMEPDPLTLPLDEYPRIMEGRILHTVAGGRLVYEATP